MNSFFSTTFYGFRLTQIDSCFSILSILFCIQSKTLLFNSFPHVLSDRALTSVNSIRIEIVLIKNNVVVKFFSKVGNLRKHCLCKRFMINMQYETLDNHRISYNNSVKYNDQNLNTKRLTDNFIQEYSFNKLVGELKNKL